MSDEGPYEPLTAHKNLDDLERRLKDMSLAVTLSAWVSLAVAFGCGIILAVALWLTSALSTEKRILMGTTFGLCIPVMMVSVCIARTQPVPLMIFTNLLTLFAAMALGYAIAII